MNIYSNKPTKFAPRFGMLTALFLLFGVSISAQTVSGTVIASEDGMPLPGVSVVLKGTSTGTSTDFDGNYSINVSDSDAVLVFSYLGFETREIEVNGQMFINVTLNSGAQALDEVVVTALGIKREEKSLGYSVEEVAGEELTRVAQE
ncbi:MAG TPA: carboxypeptidase-like regulatory domain-containing protein, partial [Pricia sp.]|nr:carboxypeptidase-like regulatory domain-containing protein [Pricia sp.]